LQMATNAGASFINIFIDVPNQKKRRLWVVSPHPQQTVR
jgi:hypothetical protein